MKYRFLSTTSDYVALVANFFVNAGIWIAFSGAAGLEVPIFLTSTIIILPVALYYVRRFVDNIALYFGLHIALGIVAFFVYRGELLETLVAVVAIMLSTVSSLVSRQKKSEPGEKPYSPVSAIALFLIERILLEFYGTDEAREAVSILALMYITIYFVNLFFKRFMWFDFVNRKVITNMPTKKLVKEGLPGAVLVSALYFVVAFLCKNESLIRKMQEGLLYIIRQIIAFFFSKDNSIEMPEFEQTPIGKDQGNMFEYLEGDYEPSKLLMIVEQILFYVVSAAIIVGLVALIIKAVLKIIRSFHGRDNKSAIELSDNYVEEKERIVPDRKNKESKRSIILSYDERIRRQYVKLVLKMGKECSNPEKVTIREFMRMCAVENMDAAEGFWTLYEKARYSPELCTKEDVEAAKRYASGIKVEK